MRTNLSSQFTPEQRKAWSPRIIARNTFRFTRDGETVTRLHATDIVRKRRDGSVVLDSGGWRTLTTKARINSALPVPWHLYQDKGAWYVVNGSWYDASTARTPFYDGIVVPDCFTDAKAQKRALKSEASEQALRLQIRKFCAKLTKDNFPIPSAGDCWLCAMRSADGRTMGDGDSSHLREHIREGYLHGSLIYNAIAWTGVAKPEIYWQMGLWDMARRHLRRYLYAQLGLAR